MATCGLREYLLIDFFIYMHFEHNVEAFLFGRFCNDDFSNHTYYQISQSPRKMIILYKQLTVT